MLSYLRFRYQLFRLERQYRHYENSDEARIKAAKARNAPDEEVQELQMALGHTVFHFEDEIQKLHSQYLLRQASRLIVSHPTYPDAEMWDKDEAGYSYLSQRGINKLRADIRAERKARVELFLMWVPGVVGILGTLIGLAAIMTGKK